MELIKPTVEIWEQGSTLEDVWHHIAACTRVCYQSTPKENGETDEMFVKRVILKPDKDTGELNFDKIHGAMLEHGTVYLHIPFYPAPGIDYINLVGKYTTNPYSKVKAIHSAEWELCSVLDDSEDEDGNIYITTNLRVIYENGWLDDLKYICAPTEHHAKRVTVSFTTNIGVSREFNRHRVNSPAEESTRYCNYNKRNDGQINIGLPAWLLDDEHLPYIKGHTNDNVVSYATGIISQEEDEILKTWCDMDFYLCALTFSQWCYNMLIKKGWKPQQAREVLSLATKSQLIHTAFVDDWKHFFALRADGVSGPPHPNAKLVAEPLKEEFIKRGYLKY